MSLTLRVSSFVLAIAWLPVAVAQLNPPLTGAGGAAFQGAAPSPAAAASAPVDRSVAARPLVRQSPAVTSSAPPAQTVQAQRAPTSGASAATATPASDNLAGSPMPTTQAPRAGSGATPADTPRVASGSTTRGLFALQASGRVAGPPRPVLGPTATAAWDRYVASFSHPIPEWFERGVEEIE